MAGGVSTSWLSTLVFFRLMISPKSLQAWENLSMRCWSSCSVCEVTAASSAKSMSLMVFSVTLLFAFSRARLKSRPSDLVRRYTPSVDAPKACFKSRAKKMPKRVGASTQPCLTPLLMSKGVDVLPSYWIVAFMSS